MTLSLGAAHFVEVCSQLGITTERSVCERLRRHLVDKYGAKTPEFRRHYANVRNYVVGVTQDYENRSVGEDLNSLVSSLGFEEKFGRPPKENEFRFDGPHANFIGRFIEKSHERHGLVERFLGEYVLLRLSTKSLQSTAPNINDEEDLYDLSITRDGTKGLSFVFSGRNPNRKSFVMGHAVFSRCLYLIGVGDKLNDAALFILDYQEDENILVGTQMLRLEPLNEDGKRLPPLIVARKVAAIRRKETHIPELRKAAENWLYSPTHAGLVVDFDLEGGSSEAS